MPKPPWYKQLFFKVRNAIRGQIKKWIKPLFCKHEYEEFLKQEPFFNLSGDRIYIICEKCGKEKGSYFRKH